MAPTLSEGLVIPEGGDPIPGNGNEPTRVLGATANTAIAGKASTAYVDARAYDRGRVPTGTDALTLASGSWTVSSTTVADTMTNLPEAWPGKLISDNGGEALVRAATFKPYARDYVWENATTTGGGWGGWRKVGTGSTSSLGSGVTNSLLVQDFSRRHGGVWPTGGKGVVSIRLDHGLLNFRDKLKPILDAAGIVPSLALNSRNWDRAENGGITAVTVDGWVAAGDVEIWNHSATHTNPTTEAGVVDEVVNGLDELRTQLPSAQIDGWAVPGVGTDPYMGMGSGTSVGQIAGSYAGRLILESHAVMTGYISGTHQRIADGVVRQAQAHFSLDSKTVTEARNEIDAAIASGTGLQLMLHPSVVDGTGAITAFQFQQIIDHVVAKRDAGELVVCSPYEMMLADSTGGAGVDVDAALAAYRAAIA